MKTTTSNTWNGVNSAGVTAAWLAEGIASRPTTPRPSANIAVTPVKAAAWVFGSYEVLEDTDFGTQLPGLLADAKDRLEEAAFATGTGTAAAAGRRPRRDHHADHRHHRRVRIADVYALHAALPPRFRNAPNCAWVANVAQINRIRQLDTAGGASFWTNLGKGQPEKLLGKGIYESQLDVRGADHHPQPDGVRRLRAVLHRRPRRGLDDLRAHGHRHRRVQPANRAGGWFMFWRVNSNVSTANAFVALKT